MKHLCVGLVVLATSCTGTQQDACGLKGDKPEIADNSLEAQSEGATYRPNQAGLRGYKLLSNRTDIVVGDFTLNVGKDRDGNSVDTLVSDSKFPICVPLNDSSDGTTYAFFYANGDSYQTDGTNTGIVAILGKEGDQLYGRFELTAKMNGGDDVKRLEDGVFRVGPRP